MFDKKKLVIVYIFFCFIIMLFLAKKMLVKDTYYNFYEEYSKNYIPVFVKGEYVLDNNALKDNNTIYISAKLVSENIDDNFYFDKSENCLIYTTPDKIYNVELNSKEYYEGTTKKNVNNPILIIKAGIPYISLEYINKFSRSIVTYYKDNNVITVQDDFSKKEKAILKKNIKLRSYASKKAPIVQIIAKGETVELLNENENKFTRVIYNGKRGFVEEKNLTKREEYVLEPNRKEYDYFNVRKDGKINMVWHQVTNKYANNNVYILLKDNKTVNVISPTWFQVADNRGNIISKADQNYVDDMQKRDIEVGPSITDFEINVDMGKLLSTKESRDKLIRNISSEIIKYNINGINVDFEKIKKSSSEDYIQFLKELKVTCKKLNVVLSVDNYAKNIYFKHYERAKQAKIVDYYVIMGYDETTMGSEQVGPNSSFEYVKSTLDDALTEVPAEKCIYALPFYSKLFVTDNTNKPKSVSNLTMSAAIKFQNDNKNNIKWDDKAKSYYYENIKGSSVEKMWIEDTKSLVKKMEYIQTKNIAGLSFWKLGLEDKNIWYAIERYNN